MGMQRERDGGMISQGIGRGVSQNPKLIGWDQMSMGEPMNPQLPFFPLPSVIHFFQKLIEAVNALGRARHGSMIVCLSKPASLQFVEAVFQPLKQVTMWMYNLIKYHSYIWNYNVKEMGAWFHKGYGRDLVKLPKPIGCD